MFNQDTVNRLMEAMEDDSSSATFQQLAGAAVVWHTLPVPRAPSIFAQRLYWIKYCKQHVAHGTFKRRLRMTHDSFNKLLEMGVHRDLEVQENVANSRGGPIIPELCLYCTIRYLAGGSYLDIWDIAGISKSFFTGSFGKQCAS